MPIVGFDKNSKINITHYNNVQNLIYNTTQLFYNLIYYMKKMPLTRVTLAESQFM